MISISFLEFGYQYSLKSGEKIHLHNKQNYNVSTFIVLEFKLVLKENQMMHTLIRSHIPDKNTIVERTSKIKWKGAISRYTGGLETRKISNIPDCLSILQ